MEIILKSIKELEEFANKLAKELTPQKDIATVVALSGELGAGKTTFVQAIARSLNIQEIVSSPTFNIIKMFSINNSNFKQLIHIDAYRLENPKELELLNWQEMLQNSHNLIFIEWPERIKEILPKHYRLISLLHNTDDSRILSDTQI